MAGKPGVCCDCGSRITLSSTSSLTPRCRECWRKAGADRKAARLKLPVRRGTPCPVCGEPKTSDGDRPCRKCDRIGSRKPRPCEVCDVVYTPTHSLQRACGRACGVTLRRLDGIDAWPSSKVTWRQCRVCEGWYTAKAGRHCGCALKPPSAYVQRKGAVLTSDCRYCGVRMEYVCKGPGDKRRVCDTCKAERDKAARRERAHRFGKSDRSRARAYGVEYEPVDRKRVYERDRWRCGLCGKKVRADLAAPHPLSPSLDHVVPMSVGGTHTYANVQCAHFLCNSLKGAGGSQQLALVG